MTTAQFTDFVATTDAARIAWNVNEQEAENKLNSLRFTLDEMRTILDVIRHSDALDHFSDHLETVAEQKSLEYKADMYAILLSDASMPI